MKINGYTIEPFTSLMNADLRGANLQNANLRGVNFGGANLQGAVLDGANLKKANFKGANLRGACLRQANLEHVNFEDSILSEAILTVAYLKKSNFRDANLEQANLTGAYLTEVSFERTNLTNANLSGTCLYEALLDGAILTNTKLPFEIGIEQELIYEIAQIVLSDNRMLTMSSWHDDDENPRDCNTAHCLAGWAITLSDQGALLEQCYGPEIAGLILLGVEAHSHFYNNETEVFSWLNNKNMNDPRKRVSHVEQV